MDDFMRMMLFSGNLNRITEEGAFAPKISNSRTSHVQEVEKMWSLLDDDSDDDDDWDDF